MNNQRIQVAGAPEGVPTLRDFALVDVPEPGGEGLLCEVRYISVDPYLRSRLGGRHLTGLIAPGQPMESELIVTTLEEHGRYPAGTSLRGFGPWQHRVRLEVESLAEVPGEPAPASLFLGVLGMPGLTAYAGTGRMLKPAGGDVMVVSAASGPVGSMVGQLCAAAGASVVGIAGTPEKCRWLTEQAGFAAAVNYKAEDLATALDRHCPDGIDGYFDNVGGGVLTAACERLALNARVVLCGLMDQYNTAIPPPGPNPGLFIRARAKVFGLVVYDHEDLRDDMIRELTPSLLNGEYVYREDVTHGLANAPEAFCRLMRGENFGKVIVDLTEPG